MDLIFKILGTDFETARAALWGATAGLLWAAPNSFWKQTRNFLACFLIAIHGTTVIVFFLHKQDKPPVGVVFAVALFGELIKDLAYNFIPVYYNNIKNKWLTKNGNNPDI
jgi:CBS-domain-containing membrane protein